ncbi:MAG: alpha/beta fold hydrolase [Acidobacteriota bacterium]
MKPMFATMLIFISPLLICAEDSAGSTSHLAIQAKPDSMPAATPLLSPAICGKSNLLFKLGEQAVGNETFEIKCRPDGGYSATAHTELKVPGASTDLNTTIDIDKSGSPTSSIARGTVAGSAFDQSVAIKDGTATITTNGKTQQLPFKEDSALLGGNIFFMFQFAIARYDTARGGSQQIPIFPNSSITVERVGRDALTPANRSAGVLTFDRYDVTAYGVGLVVWFDSRGRLAALAVPVQNFGVLREDYLELEAAFKGALAAKMKAVEPDYSAPPGAAFTAEEVTVQAKGFTLAGTLLLPKARGPFPAVITITGSGQQTRDERLPLPGLEKYRLFGQIAEALAARGIAVLRVDDRGVGKSTGLQTLTDTTTADFADDVRAQVEYLRLRREIDPNRIALVGHSEGGIIAPMVATTDPRIAAIVLMAGTAKRGDVVLGYQINYQLDMDTTLTPDAKAARRADQLDQIRKIVEGGDTSKVPEIMRSAWMKFFLTYEPLPAIARVRQPVLILQGEIDRQVTADQALMIEKAARAGGNKDVTVRLYPGLNHLFLPAKTGAPSEYTSLSTATIGEDVIKQMSDWLVEKLRVIK